MLPPRDPARPRCGAHGGSSCAHCVGQPEAPEWSVLEPADLQLLESSRITNVHRAGQVLFYQGNPCLGLHCVETGEVAIRKTSESGQSRIVRLIHAGQTLGYRAFFSGQSYSASAEALTDCRACFIPRDVVVQLLARNPALGLRFLQRTARDLGASEVDGLHVALPVRSRLVHFLLTLKDRLGTVGDDGVLRIPLPLSRQDIASRIGTRPETVTRAIRSLEEDGVATFDGRNVHVPDLDRLLDEIEPSAAAERDGEIRRFA